VEDRRTPAVGYFLGSITGGMRDGALRWNDIVALAREAEAVGFDSFWVPDHLLFRFEGQAAHAPWEGGRSSRRWPLPRQPSASVHWSSARRSAIQGCWRRWRTP
jgi:alkanesulfonate monooxygenase SsuD/methylene tetrahydromethanopterin reductase-like flavin-dependent oxidoreductase (luciferase family)